MSCGGYGAGGAARSVVAGVIILCVQSSGHGTQGPGNGPRDDSSLTTRDNDKTLDRPALNTCTP